MLPRIAPAASTPDELVESTDICGVKVPNAFIGVEEDARLRPRSHRTSSFPGGTQRRVVPSSLVTARNEGRVCGHFPWLVAALPTIKHCMHPRSNDAVVRFGEACRAGDLDAVRDTLAADVIAAYDGVGLVHGATDVARLAVMLLSGPSSVMTPESVNGRLGLALRHRGRAAAVLAIEITGARITTLWIVLDPAKLHAWHRN
jgi:hypothetical protein